MPLLGYQQRSTAVARFLTKQQRFRHPHSPRPPYPGRAYHQPPPPVGLAQQAVQDQVLAKLAAYPPVLATTVTAIATVAALAVTAHLLQVSSRVPSLVALVP